MHFVLVFLVRLVGSLPDTSSVTPDLCYITHSRRAVPVHDYYSLHPKTHLHFSKRFLLLSNLAGLISAVSPQHTRVDRAKHTL